MHSYVTLISLVCTRMSSVCHSYVLVCIRMSLVCTRMSSVCHSYVLVCHRYVTRMYSYVISMLLVCAHMSLVCTRTSSVCNSYVVLPWTFLRYLPSFFWRNEIYLNHAKSLIIAPKSTILSYNIAESQENSFKVKWNLIVFNTNFIWRILYVLWLCRWDF